VAKQMLFNKLGKSDLHISQIGFGCMSLGDDHSSNEKLLHEAVARGINFFDTADLYQKGFNEESVGRALKPFREKVILATKVGNQLRADGSGWDWNPTKKYILESVEKSLKRLQTDYIDLYQLHGGTIDDPIDETIDAFEILKRDGKIRNYGISSIRPNVIREYVKRSNIVSVMMQYSLLDRRPEEACLSLLKENNIGVLTRGSLASGLLLGKSAKLYLTHSTDDVRRVADAVQSVAADQRTPTEVALQFVFHNPAIACAVVGIRNPEQLDKAVAGSSGKSLTSEEFNNLVNVSNANQYTDHR
jgi:aryl-alcohol dehydrogenase-like predicted oxidoreductase